MENLQPRLQNASEVHFTHPRPPIFTALTSEKTNSGSLGTVLFLLRNIPSSQRRRKETQPGVPTLSALSPGDLPHVLHQGKGGTRPGEAAGSDPAQPSALRSRQQGLAEGQRGKGEGHHWTQHRGRVWFVGRKKRGEQAA